MASMAHGQALDEQIKEYLMYRGFSATLKAFDTELKSDKLRSFRVDKIVEQILHFVNIYDLNSLRELWKHFEMHIFCRLETYFQPGVKKLENAVLKMYVINTITNNKPDKMNEFFVKMTPELQNQLEWKDWFALPYIKNPEDNPTFSLHFTKQWQDTLLLSLHNFLATVFQYMPVPTLMQFEETANTITKLQQRNDQLRERLALLIEKGPEANITPCQVEPPPPLLDDFYIIAQESNAAESQAKSLKNLIRNMGTSSSPILGRKDTSKKKTARN